VGKKAVDDCSILNENLAKHRWIPGLPHHEILQIMRANDILVFPTLFDGFGLVISEAMSQGTPVIATNNSAGPDLIEHGRNGWLAEAGSIPSLLTIIENLIEKPGLIAKAGVEAMETARLRPWAIFRHELSEAVRHHYNSIPQNISYPSLI
jgi:glycosyltransferase involved in cell wall biosynthesis